MQNDCSRKRLSSAVWPAIMLALFILGNCSAELAPIFNLEDIVRSSDTIVIGQVGITPLASPVGAYQVKVTVLQTIVGTGDSSSFFFTFVPKGMGIKWGISGSTRIIFLRHLDGDVELANERYGTLPAVNVAPLADLDTLGAVIAEEGEVIGSPNSSESDKREAIFSLQNSKDTRTIAALKKGLNDTSDVIRLETVSRLAIKGDMSAVLIAESALLDPPTNLPDFITHNLQVGVRDGARMAAIVPDIAKLLKVSDNATREAAAEALSHIKYSSTIAPLREALSDPDPKVRYFAIVGLATYTGHLKHMPNLINFRTNEAEYMNYWTQWVPATKPATGVKLP